MKKEIKACLLFLASLICFAFLGIIFLDILYPESSWWAMHNISIKAPMWIKLATLVVGFAAGLRACKIMNPSSEEKERKIKEKTEKNREELRERKKKILPPDSNFILMG